MSRYRSKAERERMATCAKARARRMRRTTGTVVAIAGLVAGAMFWAATRSENGAVAEKRAQLATWDRAWDAIPQRRTPARSMATVRDAYAFAANREDIVRYIPCYCGCEREGHRSLRDCFIKGRAADGRPKWDPMGYT